MKKTCEAKGKTREEAIDIALEQLDLTIDEVTIEDIEEGSKNPITGCLPIMCA